MYPAVEDRRDPTGQHRFTEYSKDSESNGKLLMGRLTALQELTGDASFLRHKGGIRVCKEDVLPPHLTRLVIEDCYDVDVLLQLRGEHPAATAVPWDDPCAQPVEASGAVEHRSLLKDSILQVLVSAENTALLGQMYCLRCLLSQLINGRINIQQQCCCR